MKRFVLLDTAPIPGANGALNLFEHGEDFVIRSPVVMAGN